VTRKGKLMARNANRDLLSKCRKIALAVAKRLRRDGFWKPMNSEDDFSNAIDTVELYWREELEAVLLEYGRKRTSYEPLFSMPPARRPKVVKTGKPLTLVERRAASAKRKVREWQRKSKLAATKIKQYRKKVSYYTKKGVIQ
jgi:hypothetical protein